MSDWKSKQSPALHAAGKPVWEGQSEASDEQICIRRPLFVARSKVAMLTTLECMSCEKKHTFSTQRI
jgi:hypothetical protein